MVGVLERREVTNRGLIRGMTPKCYEVTVVEEWLFSSSEEAGKFALGKAQESEVAE